MWKEPESHVTDDQIFRVIVLAGLLATLPVGIYHRLQSRTGEALDRRQEGLFVLVGLRLLGLLGIGGLLAYVIDPAWMRWSQVPLPSWLRWSGVPPGVAAAGLLVWTFRALGPNLTDTVVTRERHTLVIDGPYRWVRHPFYVAFALTAVAYSLLTANAFLATAFGLAFVLLVVRTGREEDHLVGRFGDEYRRYMARTGRFLPQLRYSPADTTSPHGGGDRDVHRQRGGSGRP